MNNANKEILCAGNRLKHFREAILKLSQTGLGKELDCSQQKVNLLEKGKQELNYKDLAKLIELGLDVHWLFSGKGNMLYSRQSLKKQAQEFISVLETFVE